MTTEPKAERKFLGVTLGDVVKLILAAIVGFTAARWNSTAPHLTYRVDDPLPSSNKDQKKPPLYLAVTTIDNDGSKEAEDLDCALIFSGQNVEGVDTAPYGLQVTHSKEVHSFDDNDHPQIVRVRVPVFNPGEFLQVITITKPDSATERKLVSLDAAARAKELRPWVTVRAKGVVGERLTAIQRSASSWKPFLALLAAIPLLIGIYGLISWLEKRMPYS
jgi:hypothetical protein